MIRQDLEQLSQVRIDQLAQHIEPDTVPEHKRKPVRIAGQVLDPAKRYRLATNAFVASGGDGYPKLDGLPGFVDSGLTDAEVLTDYLSASYPLLPVPAR